MRLDDIYKKVEAWDKEIKKELSETASRPLICLVIVQKMLSN